MTLKIYYNNKTLLYQDNDLQIILDLVKNLPHNSSLFEIESFLSDSILEFYKTNQFLKFFASHSTDFYDLENFNIKQQIKIRQENFNVIPNFYYFMCEARAVFPHEKIKMFIINNYKSVNSTLSTFFHCLELKDNSSTIIFNNIDKCDIELSILKNLYPNNWNKLSNNLIGFNFE